MEDSRGVTRGACSMCGCTQYCLPTPTEGTGSWKCSTCGHFPTKHLKLGAMKTCLFRGCYAALDFDLNTGIGGDCCPEHEGYQEDGESFTSSTVPGYTESESMQIEDVEYDETVAVQQPSWNDQCSDAGMYLTDGVIPPMPAQQPVLYVTTSQPGSQTSALDQAQVVQCLDPGKKKCAIPKCPNPRYIDENQREHECCGKTHAQELEKLNQAQSTGTGPLQPQVVASAPAQLVPVVGSANGQPPSSSTTLPSGERKCAIAECQNRCFVDGSGTVHECCGVTHAMEHKRRKTIEQQKQVVKGVTHCLLPECNHLVWPFKNYCGKSHADIGRQRQLVPPAPPGDPSAPKDSSLCIIPGCTSKKFADSSGGTHPYCGNTHAELGKKMNIFPTADKKEDECELPECQKPKRKEGARVHDYCCASHAQQDAPNRDARILKDMAEITKYLDSFSKLKGYTITENQHAKPPGGSLFGRFKQKWDSLPKSQRVTCLAFHGTADNNISSICQNGYDPKLRRGQAHGAGEYFATTPDIPLGYCRGGGKRMLLNELLLGQQGTHHTVHSTIVVMKDPAHDLPRFVVTFK